MESTPEQSAEGLAIIKVLAEVLERLVGANKGLARADPGQVTKFHALKAPGIAILPYLERIHKYASCSNECFILALIYIDRLIQRNNFLLTDLNVHRVVITAILLAAKFFDDAYYNNAYYSKVGGVLVSEMNGLEVDFLFRINFSLHVSPEVFEKYKAELVAHSINCGMTLPPAPPLQATLAESLDAGAMTGEQSTAQHRGVVQGTVPDQTTVTHQALPEVTPSPRHASNHLVSAPLPAAGPQQMEPDSLHPLFAAAENVMLANGITQQMLQRANSMPPFPTTTGRCVNRATPYSAPTLSMLPVEEQYMVVNNQIFPLQTTLVHHHHGVENYHIQEQPSFPATNTTGYPLTRDSMGSLVAGHY